MYAARSIMGLESKQIGVWDQDVPKGLSARCGWCRHDVQMLRIGETVEAGREPYSGGQEFVWVVVPCICPRPECRRASLVCISFRKGRYGLSGLEIAWQLPRGVAEEMEGLPEAIADVRHEAWSCFYGGDRRAAVVMGRAAVQRAVRTLGGQGHNLFQEIDDLHANHKVTSELRDWAHEVRLAAGEAAHPDEIGDVTVEEAKESLEWMDAFLEFAVALPERRRAKAEAAAAEVEA